MSKPWGGGIGAWAAETERAEAEEKEEAAAAAAAAVGGDSHSFPSLSDAVNTKQKKKTKMSLQEFTMQGSFPAGGGATRRGSAIDYKGLTPDEMFRLPTGPKERSADEMQFGRLGGGFSSYGRSSGPPRRDRDGEGDNSWGSNRRSYGGFDEDRRAPPPRVSDYDQPSRADEVDNWASTKKPMSSFDSGRPNRYSALGGGISGGGGGGGGGISRADEVDNWGVGKKPVAVPPRSSSFGSGFRDSGPEPDRWSRGGGGGGTRDGDQERPRLVLDPRRSEGVAFEPVKTNKPNPFGAARPREEILAEKGLDWKKVDMELEGKRPTSSHSSRPGSSQSIQSEGIEGAVKPRPKVNPFGDAKPREVLLEEKGLDWKKIDLELEHRRVERPETEAEKNLKEEIDQLKSELEKESASNTDRVPVEGSGEDQTSLHDLILNKERDLELLIRELDDKVRFGQKAIERPGSGAGRVASFPERPSSRAGSVEESRNVEFMERPQSRGTGDSWGRQQGDDRRAFPGGRERGFLGNRDLDRPRSRDRW